MKPRILITGCSGLIGSRMAIQAKEAGADVVACARSRTEKLSMEIGMPVIAIDVLQPIMLKSERTSIDAIIHCATANDIVSRDFGAGVELSVIGTRHILEYAIKQGVKKVAAYGAAAKGNTLLNFAGVMPDLLPFVCDAAPSKQNKYLPGIHIPIRHPDALAAATPDYLVILPWNITDEVIAPHGALRAKGTRFVTFMPDMLIR